MFTGLVWSSLYFHLDMKLLMGFDCCLEQFVQSRGAVRLLLCCGEGRGESLSQDMAVGDSGCICGKGICERSNLQGN